MDYQEGKVEISYQVMSESMGILTVAIFMDQQLLHIISGEKEMMISKINQIFKENSPTGEP